MKKILMLSLSLLLTASMLIGCGAPVPQEVAPTASPDATAQAPAEGDNAEGGNAESGTTGETTGETGENSVTNPNRPAASENKEVVKEESAPKVYIMPNAGGTESITYHLESCKLLEGKEKQEVSWAMIKEVQFWQCPECDPPRYEDYQYDN